MTEMKLPEIEHEQRTEEWLKARRGKVTASRIGDILATIRNGNFAASRKNYAAELVAERLNPGKVVEPFTNEYIEWGIAQEPAAREAYSAKTGNQVSETGFIVHPLIELSGASPDGFVFDDGLLEIKCPTTATHMQFLLNEEIKEQYMLQMLWQMACTGRKWCDFVSYDPRMPEDMQLAILRVERDDERIKEVEEAVKVFLDEVAELEAALLAKFRTSKTKTEKEF